MSPRPRLFYTLSSTKRAAPCGAAQRGREGGQGSDRAENVAVCAHSVVVHEQLASEGFVVEVSGEVAHSFFEVVAFLNDVPGEVFLAVPFSAVGFLEVVEIIVELQIVVDSLGGVFLTHFSVFFDVVEVFLGYEPLVVPLTGEALEVLCHKLGVFLVGVYRLAEVYKYLSPRDTSTIIKQRLP